jgi:hypothetical protein
MRLSGPDHHIYELSGFILLSMLSSLDNNFNFIKIIKYKHQIESSNSTKGDKVKSKHLPFLLHILQAITNKVSWVSLDTFIL